MHIPEHLACNDRSNVTAAFGQRLLLLDANSGNRGPGLQWGMRPSLSLLQEGMPGNPIDLDDEEEGEEYAQDDLDQEEDADGLEYVDEGADPNPNPIPPVRMTWIRRRMRTAWSTQMRVPPPFIPPIRPRGRCFGLCDGATRCGSGCGAWPETWSCRMRHALGGTAQGVRAAPAWSELREDKVADVFCVFPLQTPRKCLQAGLQAPRRAYASMRSM